MFLHSHKKPVVYIMEVSCTPEDGEHPEAHGLRWLSVRRTHLYRNLPYN